LRKRVLKLEIQVICGIFEVIEKEHRKNIVIFANSLIPYPTCPIEPMTLPIISTLFAFTLSGG